MQFLQPALLSWLALLAVPLLLYLFRRRPQIVRVSTLPFFRQLAREHQESTWLRRLKKLISLLLSLLIILLAVSSLAELIFGSGDETEASHVLILVDQSASMAATDAAGTSQMDRALARTRARVRRLPPSTTVTIVTYANRPQVLLPPSQRWRDIDRALQRIETRNMPGEAERALRFVRNLASQHERAEIWHVTEGSNRIRQQDTDLVTIDGGALAGINVGISAFEIRRNPMSVNDFEAFVEVCATGAETVKANLNVHVDEQLVGMRSLDISSERPERLIIPIKASDGERLHLALESERDVLEADNHLMAWIPERHPLKVVWISENPTPFTHIALNTLAESGDIDFFHTKPDSWEAVLKAGVDLLILDAWMPDKLPEEVPFVLINPPANEGAIPIARVGEDGLPLAQVRTTDLAHPLLHGVASDRVALTQTAILPENLRLEPLWTGPVGPILAAGELGNRRAIILAFDPDLSEHLPLLASWPILLSNAIHWSCQPLLEQKALAHRRTGEILETEAGTLEWLVPGSEGKWMAQERQSTTLELDRIGLWRTQSGRRGSASLLSVGESQLRVDATLDAQSLEEARSEEAGSLPTSDWLLWIILLILIGESALFHRKAVY